MKIYILFIDCNFEGSNIIAIFSTREKAEKELKSLNSKIDDYFIEEYEVK